MSLVNGRLGAVADWIDSERGPLTEEMLERQLREVPEYLRAGDPAIALVARDSIAALLRHTSDVLRETPDGWEHLPAAAVEEARVAARGGVPWVAFDRCFRVGHAVLWERLLEASERWPLEAGERTALLRRLSRLLFDYMDRVVAELAEVHGRERDRQIRGRERQRIAWVRELLANVPGARALHDHPLDRPHLGVVAAGPEAERAITGLAHALGGVALVVPADDAATRWGWISGAPALEGAWAAVARRHGEALRGDAAAGAGGRGGGAAGGGDARLATSLAIGAVAAGADGFRLTHRQAREAAAVARRAGAATVLYEDVALEALALRDERAARDFVEHELGPLLRDERRGEVLLQTLDACVRASWTTAAAAALLGVHERTVGYRLATVEQRLGRPLVRRAELAAALRLRRLL